jgi:acyl dehydratase
VSGRAGLLLQQVKAGDRLPELAVPVSATTVILGALASRDWRPMHHDRDFAQKRNGVRDIFLNTPNQAAWFERFLTDWSGPKGRLGRMQFRMKASIFPGDTMTFSGVVEKVETDGLGCGWAEVALAVSVDGRAATECRARVALPLNDDDNPWERWGDDWKP